MKKLIYSGIYLALFLVVIAPMTIFGQNIEIQVSPNILNLNSHGVVVTIHTDIAYSTVDGSTVTLNDVEIQSWKSDNQGNFVAKFNMDVIKGLPGLKIGEFNTITLNGLTSSGETFTGSEDVLVINKVPKGR